MVIVAFAEHVVLEQRINHGTYVEELLQAHCEDRQLVLCFLVPQDHVGRHRVRPGVLLRQTS